jgi:hypothetical protein
MKRTLLVALCAGLVVTGCARISESRLNPFNWFGGAQGERRFELPAEAADDRALAPEVLDLTVEPYSGGALVKAVAQTPDQGWWDAELVARPLDADGVLVYDLRMFPPVTATPVGPNTSRQVTVAAAISSVMLERVTKIVVQGEGNALSSGR